MIEKLVENEKPESTAPSELQFRPAPVLRPADQIRHQVVDAVARGDLRPGDRLPNETALAKQFGVTRAEVRAGFQSLVAMGLIERTRGRTGGMRIARPRPDEVQQTLRDGLSLLVDLSDVTLAELAEARRETEAACARVAACRRDEEDLARMEQAIASSRDPSLPDAEWLELDIAFHRAVAEATKNRVLALPLSAVHAVAQPRLNTLILHLLDRKSIADQHEAIYLAIRSQEPHAADEAVGRHVQYLQERYATLPKALFGPFAERQVAVDGSQASASDGHGGSRDTSLVQ